MGVETKFDVKEFKRNLKIEIQFLSDNELVFDLIGVDPAIANAFRRILISEVSQPAVNSVTHEGRPFSLEKEKKK
jgi:DNA-directed RNA polymerase I and III subunit RPAC1